MRNWLQWAATACVLLPLACTTPVSRADSNPNLEVYSWWQSDGEKAAFAELVRPFKVQHPGARVENVYRADSEAVRGDLGGLLLLGAPPDTFQTNAGADLLRWAAVDYASEAGSEVAGTPAPPEAGFSLLADVSALLHETGALEAMYSEVRRAVCVRMGGEERYFAVPVNVHRINLLYYNRNVVQDLGVPPEELFTLGNLCPEDLATERLPFRISIAASDTFSLLLLTFENLLLSLAGPDSYLGFFTGEPAPGWRAEMERVLGCLWYLSRSFRTPNGWADAVREVAAGQAAMTVMGDWANPEFASAVAALQGAGDRSLHEVVGRMQFPGTEAYFAFTSDSFPQPLEAGSPEHTRSLLRSFAQLETQSKFGAAKGSIPALRGGAPAISDRWALESLNAFESADQRKVLATSGLFPSYVSQARVTEELRALIYVETLSDVPAAIRRILDLFESSLPLFRTWRQRLQPCD